MKKLFALLILLLILPVSVNAHAGLSSSTPAEGESLDASTKEIRFQFDSPIEQGEMTIVEASGSAIEFSDVSPSENELIGQLETELPNGSYVVDWNVLSQDGHEVAGTLTFNVEAEAVEETEEAAAEETVDTAAETEEAAPPAEEEQQTSAVADDAAEETTPWMTIILIVILAVAAVTIFVMARRK